MTGFYLNRKYRIRKTTNRATDLQPAADPAKSAIHASLIADDKHTPGLATEI